MTPCRAYLTACALGLAFGALIGLMVANRILMALDDAHGAAREAHVSRDDMEQAVYEERSI